MIAVNTWVILVPYADGGTRPIWREHNNERYASEADARAHASKAFFIHRPFIIAKVLE